MTWAFGHLITCQEQGLMALDGNLTHDYGVISRFLK